MDKSGKNINNILDTTQIGYDFLNFFYNNLSNKEELLNKNVIKEYTEFKYNDIVYKHDDLLSLLETLSKENITINNTNILTSGSRRLDILVSGFINDNIFVQFFSLCNLNNTWYIKNSLININ